MPSFLVKSALTRLDTRFLSAVTALTPIFLADATAARCTLVRGCVAVAMQSGQRRPGYSRQRFGFLGLRWQCTPAQSINPRLCTEEQAAANSAFLASLIIHRSQAQVTGVRRGLRP